MNINEKIYRNVKALCKMNGRGLNDIEQQIGRNPGYLSRKSTKVDVETLVKLGELLDVSTDHLMYWDFDRELERKEALESLKSAVLDVNRFYNKEGILNYIMPLIAEEELAKEEDDEVGESV